MAGAHNRAEELRKAREAFQYAQAHGCSIRAARHAMLDAQIAQHSEALASRRTSRRMMGENLSQHANSDEKWMMRD